MSDGNTEPQSILGELKALVKKYGIEVEMVTTVRQPIVKLENSLAVACSKDRSCETLVTVTRGERVWQYLLTRVEGPPPYVWPVEGE